MRVSRAVAVALLGAVVVASAAMAQTTYLKEAAYTTKWPAVELSSSAIFVSCQQLSKPKQELRDVMGCPACWGRGRRSRCGCALPAARPPTGRHPGARRCRR
jgi:hypothetical protein